jgi:hypothetical protein
MKRLLIATGLALAIILTLSGCGATAQAQSQSHDDLTVTLSTEPSTPLVGRATTFQIDVQQAGAPLNDARVTLMRRMPGMEHHEDKGLLIAQPTGDGQYAAQTAFAMGGRWEVIVTVVGEETDTQPLTFSIDVEQP